MEQWAGVAALFDCSTTPLLDHSNGTRCAPQWRMLELDRRCAYAAYGRQNSNSGNSQPD